LTNFEKWKNEMTIEKLMEWLEDDCFADKCPAFEICKDTEGCKESWIKWAESETNA